MEECALDVCCDVLCRRFDDGPESTPQTGVHVGSMPGLKWLKWHDNDDRRRTQHLSTGHASVVVEASPGMRGSLIK